MRIGILTPSITTGDAVSNDVLGMYEALRGRGYETRIFAEGWTFAEPKIWPAHKLHNFLKGPADLLIYHYSRGWELGLKLLREQKYRTAVKYHNVTPAEFLEGFSKDLADLCREGRAQLKEIARAGCALFLSASPYNELELLQQGVDAQKSFVVPPFHHIDRLSAIEPDREVLDAYGDGHTNILMVGRVVPNKGHPKLIEAFAAYHRDYNRASRLFIVGKEETRLNTYNRWLHHIATHLKVDHAVVFAGEVADGELKAYYSLADAFMITSEHEGFCVPLIEAMSMKVPIVAYGSSAIPDTVNGGGLVWDERNPYLLAESINWIAKNKENGVRLGEMGHRRYEKHFTNQRIESQFLKAIGSLL
jgi:glycosyltransferase involved in cell wall biosynthesis